MQATTIKPQPTSSRVARQSNLELSRILAMLLIVAHHFSVHGGVPIWSADAPLSWNFYLDQLLSAGGKIGVNLFVLITGYFLVYKITKLSALLYLWVTTAFYSLLFFGLFTLFGSTKFSFGALVANFFPIRNDLYWFVSAYFMLMLLSPFVTFGINALGAKRLLAFLLVLGFFWSVVPTATTKPEYYGSTLLWFVYLFSWGAWLRMSEASHLIRPSLLWAALLASLASVALLIGFADWFNRLSPSRGYIDWFTFANMTSVFSLSAALSLFLLFKSWDIGARPWINRVAAAMLGVYLIHENPLVYPWLWKTVFDVSSHLNSSYFALYAAVVIVGIFVACTLLDLVREHFMRRAWSAQVAPKLKKSDEAIAAFFQPLPRQG